MFGRTYAVQCAGQQPRRRARCRRVRRPDDARVVFACTDHLHAAHSSAVHREHIDHRVQAYIWLMAG